MNDTHEVISAFLDDEPFDANELAASLAGPEGRQLLIDLVAMRHVMQPDQTAIAFAERRKAPGWRGLLATAAVVVALVGGYWAGQRQGEHGRTEAPPATRVVETGEWQSLP